MKFDVHIFIYLFYGPGYVIFTIMERVVVILCVLSYSNIAFNLTNAVVIAMAMAIVIDYSI